MALSRSTQGRGFASLFHLSTPGSLSVRDATMPAMSAVFVTEPVVAGNRSISSWLVGGFVNTRQSTQSGSVTTTRPHSLNEFVLVRELYNLRQPAPIFLIWGSSVALPSPQPLPVNSGCLSECFLGQTGCVPTGNQQFADGSGFGRSFPMIAQNACFFTKNDVN